MNLGVEPLDKMRFKSISKNSKRLLFKHNSLLLDKYDPNLQETFLEQQKERALREFRQKMAMAADEEHIDMTPCNHKAPALTLNTRNDEPMLYSEKSLINLAFNNS